MSRKPLLLVSVMFSVFSFISEGNSCIIKPRKIVVSEEIDLGGETWFLPHKSRLVFEGGRIKNGEIVFSESTIEAIDGFEPEFVDVAFSGAIKSMVSPSWFLNKNMSATEILQCCINSSEVVDLRGDCLRVGKVCLKAGLCMKNGELQFDNTDYCLYGVRVNGVCIQNVIVKGNNDSECGLFISDSENVKIENVLVSNIYSDNAAAVGIYLRRCLNASINNCQIKEVEAIPNGRVGDSPGASRAIVIQHCFNTRVVNSVIERILSAEDGDGIHIINEADSRLGSIEICNSIIKNCSRRLIKVQAPGVAIRSNQFLTDDEHFSLDYTLSLFSSNCLVDGNIFNASSPIPIQVGGKGAGTISEVVISNNTILDRGKSNQGAVTISSPINKFDVIYNAITLFDNSECGVYIRSACSDIRINNNVLEGGRGLVFIREQQSGTMIHEVEVSENQVITSGYFFALSVPNEDEPVSRIKIQRNIVSVNNLTYQSDAIFVSPISAVLRNRISVLDNHNDKSIPFNRRTTADTVIMMKVWGSRLYGMVRVGIKKHLYGNKVYI